MHWLFECFIWIDWLLFPFFFFFSCRFELLDYYEKSHGKLSELSESDYHKITGSKFLRVKTDISKSSYLFEWYENSVCKFWRKLFIGGFLSIFKSFTYVGWGYPLVDCWCHHVVGACMVLFCLLLSFVTIYTTKKKKKSFSYVLP